MDCEYCGAPLAGMMINRSFCKKATNFLIFTLNSHFIVVTALWGSWLVARLESNSRFLPKEKEHERIEI